MLLGVLMLFLTYCKDSKSFTQDSAVIDEQPQRNDIVDIEILQKKTFQNELLANGKLSALQQSVLKFNVSGALQILNVKNGDKVNKGQILAALESFKYRQAFSKAETTLQKAMLDFEDMLVGRGYDLAQRDSIPDNIYEMAYIRSGLKEAQNQLKDTQFELASATLTAPFSGKVAGIRYKRHEQVNTGTSFMTLINDSMFEVEFYLIESELDKVKLGESISVEAFEKENIYEGKVTSINPLVEKNGTILVKALIESDGLLLEGMNVKVRIQKDIPNQFVVPKSAVILRQNKEVIFKYKKGRTYWTYVTSIHENSSSYAIIADSVKSSASLTIGDTIIISGNLNLAHDTEVVLKNNQ